MAFTWSDVREALLIAVLVLTTSTSPAHAESGTEAQKGPWIGMGFGLSNQDSVEVADDSLGSFKPADFLAPSLSVQAYYTTLRFDFGALICHMTGGGYQRPNGTDGRFGAMVSAGPFVRWRYWNTLTGAFYLEIMPAWTAVVHSEYLRRDSAVMHGLDPEDIPEVTHLLSGSTGTGFLWMLYPDVALNFNINLWLFDDEMELGDKAGTGTDTCDGGDCISYERFRTGVRLSLVWTL